MLLWELRDDLQEDFPLPAGRDLFAFASWFIDVGADDAGITGELVEVTRKTLAARTPAAFDNGVACPEVALRALRRFDPRGIHWSEPRVTAGTDSFYGWLLAPLDPQHSIFLPRLARLLWLERDDLQHDFPDPEGRDLVPLAEWYAGVGAENAGLAEELIEPTRRSLGAWFFATFDNGVPCPRLAHEARIRLDPGGERWPQPQVVAGESSFYAWLLAPRDAEHPIQLPQIAHLLWQERDDLQRDFPDPEKDDCFRFAEWLVERGASGAELPEVMTEPTRRTLNRWYFAAFDNGVACPRLAHEARERLDPRAQRWPQPQVVAGDDSFYSWLLAPLVPGHPIHLPRIARLVWEQRQDLQQTHADPEGADLYRFAEWWIERSAEAEGLANELIEPTRRALAAREPAEFANGVKMPGVALRALRRLDPGGERWPDSGTTGDDSFYAWLLAPEDGDAGSPHLPRIALLLWQERHDLQEVFVDPTGSERHAYASWFISGGSQEAGVPEDFCEPIRRSLAPGSPA
jgi:uncharacterized protein YozE (UPF0346 family)